MSLLWRFGLPRSFRNPAFFAELDLAEEAKILASEAGMSVAEAAKWLREKKMQNVGQSPVKRARFEGPPSTSPTQSGNLATQIAAALQPFLAASSHAGSSAGSGDRFQGIALVGLHLLGAPDVDTSFFRVHLARVSDRIARSFQGRWRSLLQVSPVRALERQLPANEAHQPRLMRRPVLRRFHFTLRFCALLPPFCLQVYVLFLLYPLLLPPLPTPNF